MTTGQIGDGPIELKLVIIGVGLAPITVFENYILAFGS